MANNNFRKDLAIGELGEKIVVDWLCQTYNGTFLSENKTNTHDVIINFANESHEIWKGDVSLEIKTDVYCKPEKDTGNMFIEYESRGKPSGISVCEADVFMTYYKNLNELWAIETNKLRELIAANKFRKIFNAGDKGSRTHAVLIPRNKVKEHFFTYIL